VTSRLGGLGALLNCLWGNNWARGVTRKADGSGPERMQDEKTTFAVGVGRVLGKKKGGQGVGTTRESLDRFGVKESNGGGATGKGGFSL